MFRKFKIIWLSALAFLAFIAGCNNHEADKRMSTSIIEVSKYISTQKILFDSVQWEIVTIPDSSQSSVPGPTDYVSLIALIKTNQKSDVIENHLPVKTDAFAVPQQFILNWLPLDASYKLSQIGKSGIITRDASGLTVRPAKRAYAIETKDGLLFYVEYISP